MAHLLMKKKHRTQIADTGSETIEMTQRPESCLLLLDRNLGLPAGHWNLNVGNGFRRLISMCDRPLTAPSTGSVVQYLTAGLIFCAGLPRLSWAGCSSRFRQKF